MSTDAERLEDEVADIRERMANRIDELTDHFAPQSLLARATGNPNPDFADAIDLVVETVRRNPLSAALIGAGVAGIVGSRAIDKTAPQPTSNAGAPLGVEGTDADGRRFAASGAVDPSIKDQIKERTSAMTRATKDTAHTLKEQATGFLSDATDSAREKAADVLETTSAYASDTREALAKTADDLSNKSRRAGQAAARKSGEVGGWVRDNPVATGLMVMAAGAAIGSVLTARRSSAPVKDAGETASEMLHEQAAQKAQHKDGLRGADRFEQLSEKATAGNSQQTARHASKPAFDNGLSKPAAQQTNREAGSSISNTDSPVAAGKAG